MNAASAGAGLKARFKGQLGAFHLDVTLNVAPRGITALIGPSGSGKSTVLRCIAGLTRLDGEASFAGEVWQDARRFTPAHRRPIGFVFQDAGLLAHLTVKGNLAYAEKRVRTPEAIIARDEVIELLGLARLLDRHPGRLSGGERQRVALGRALLTQPRLILMDEPMASLDAQAKAEILPYLERLHDRVAVPSLYISHDAVEVARLADHVLRMKDGRIVEAPADQAELRLAAMSAEEKDALALTALRAGFSV